MDLAAPLSLAAYRRFLTVWWGFLRPLEPVLLAEPAPMDLRSRAKLPWLEADLCTLGMDAAARDHVASGTCALAAGASWGRRMGFVYVIEGATLGGQVLLRQVAATLPGALPATRFLRSYGDNVGVMWRQVVAALESTMTTPAAEAEVIAAACEAFEAFAARATAEATAHGSTAS